MNARLARTLGSVIAATLLLGGTAACDSDSKGGGTPSTPSGPATSSDTATQGATGTETGSATSPATSAAVNQAELARFYEQKLAWKPCETAAQCADLEVPVDYSKPEGETLKIKVLKVGATLPGKKKGSLVVNPGGPGGSGVEYASYAPMIVSPKVLLSYDIVGFDPRGVGQSSPIWCFEGQEMDDYLAADPTPDDAAEEKEMQVTARKFGESCKSRGGSLFAHVSTEEAARDMDVLRAALGDDKLNFLGKSYGTFLGATYAGLFPQKVGRFVLDGAVAPDLTSKEMGLGQAEGFQRATNAYIQDCTKQADCPVGKSLPEGQKYFKDLMKRLDTKPVPVTKDSRVTELTEGWAQTGVVASMYRPADWVNLTAALKEINDSGKGDKMMELANQYADRDAGGTYKSNLLQALNAVNCLDRPDSANLEDFRKDLPEYEAKAPTFGSSMVWSGVTCGVWPAQTGKKPEKIAATGSAPILVVGTTRDPATPYEWAQRLAGQLDNGHLLSFDGDGHTAYYRLESPNSCVNDAVDGYLLDGKVPAEGTMCK